MAKGNVLLGYGRGSIGDVVLSRVKGQQVAKARNRKPANPRTQSQMMQRSRFLSPVKFFARGIQALFEFAFEDKKAFESDYNAFMRHNAKRGIYLTKANADNASFPAVGSFIMTKGSLTNMGVMIDEIDGGAGVVILGHVPANKVTSNTTWGDLCKALKESGCQITEGTIITFYHITTDAKKDAQDILYVEENAAAPKWDIKQIVFDSTSTMPLAEAPVVLMGDEIAKDVILGEPVLESAPDGFGYVLSQKTANGLKVSTSIIQLSGVLAAGFDAMTTASYGELVASSWGASEDAILQGSIAKKAAASAE